MKNNIDNSKDCINDENYPWKLYFKVWTISYDPMSRMLNERTYKATVHSSIIPEYIPEIFIECCINSYLFLRFRDICASQGTWCRWTHHHIDSTLLIEIGKTNDKCMFQCRQMAAVPWGLSKF